MWRAQISRQNKRLIPISTSRTQSTTNSDPAAGSLISDDVDTRGRASSGSGCKCIPSFPTSFPASTSTSFATGTGAGVEMKRFEDAVESFLPTPPPKLIILTLLLLLPLRPLTGNAARGDDDLAGNGGGPPALKLSRVGVLGVRDEKNDAMPLPQPFVTPWSGVAGTGGCESEDPGRGGAGLEGLWRGEIDEDPIRLKGRIPFTVVGFAGVSDAACGGRIDSCESRGEAVVEGVGEGAPSSVLVLRCSHRPRTPSTALKNPVDPAASVLPIASRVGASCCSILSSWMPSVSRRPMSATTEGLSLQGCL